MKLLFILITMILTLACNQSIIKIDGRKLTTSEELQAMIQKGEAVFIKDAVFEEDINFDQIGRHHITGKGNAITEIPVAIVFENCVFKGKITGHQNLADGVSLRTRFLGSLSFEGCLFEKSVDLNGAIFSAPNFWRKNLFRKNLNITGSIFEHHFSISENIIDGEFRSNQVRFRGGVDFFGSEFNGITFFQGSIFYEDALFLNTTFRDNLDFTLSRVLGGLYFNYSTIKGRSFFNGSNWGGRVEFNSANFQNSVEFKRVQFSQQPEFNKTLFNNSPDIQESTILTKIQFNFS